MIDEYEFRKRFRMRFTQLVERDGRKLGIVEQENGIHGAILGNYRDGRAIPTAYNLLKVCQIYGVSADWLLGLSDKGGPEE